MRKSRGFSLVETIVSVSIIAMTASLLVPVFQRVREGGRQVMCLNNQRQIALAATIWAQDNDENLPAAGAVWDDIEMPAGSLRCPSQNSPAPVADGQVPNDFAYSGFIAGKSVASVKHPAAEILVADAGQSALHPAPGSSPNVFLQQDDISLRHQGAYIAGFCDGHVEMRTELPPYWISEIADGLISGMSIRR